MIGVVTEKTGAGIAGVTVVATSSSLRGTMAEITNEAGQYVLADLPPGTYQITFYYSESKIERSGVAVRRAAQHVVDQTIDTGAAPTGERIVIVTKRGAIDTRPKERADCFELNTNCGGNVPLPGRTFEGAILTVDPDYIKNVPPPSARHAGDLNGELVGIEHIGDSHRPPWGSDPCP